MVSALEDAMLLQIFLRQLPWLSDMRDFSVCPMDGKKTRVSLQELMRLLDAVDRLREATVICGFINTLTPVCSELFDGCMRPRS